MATLSDIMAIPISVKLRMSISKKYISGVCGPTAIMCVSWLGGWASKRFFFAHCDMVRFDGDLRDMYTVYVHNMFMYMYIYICVDHQQYDIGFLVNMVIPQLMAICKCCQSAGK